ncbi:cyclin-A2 [Caerostris darwini]|uniref:Cyclin-A2 n=1 Tax=Caerostris darwini TaxID=1538125 RepID=A0AAV4TPZ6_9ARAC|nr:cyclin-A2 [Caerostris darwini]
MAEYNFYDSAFSIRDPLTFVQAKFLTDGGNKNFCWSSLKENRQVESSIKKFSDTFAVFKEEKENYPSLCEKQINKTTKKDNSYDSAYPVWWPETDYKRSKCDPLAFPEKKPETILLSDICNKTFSWSGGYEENRPIEASMPSERLDAEFSVFNEENDPSLCDKRNSYHIIRSLWDSNIKETAVGVNKSDIEEKSFNQGFAWSFFPEDGLIGTGIKWNDVSTFNDKVLSSPEKSKDHYNSSSSYDHDIYKHLLELEVKYLSELHLCQIKNLEDPRIHLVDWMIEVCDHFKLFTTTLHIAIYYVDKYLSHKFVEPLQLQLIGITALLIASKLENGCKTPDISQFAIITGGLCNRKQIGDMEKSILRAMNFDLQPPNSFEFLMMFCSICNIAKRISYLAQYICEIALLYIDVCIQFKPSQIAVAALVLANYVLQETPWSYNLMKFTGYKKSDIKTTVYILAEVFSNIQFSTCKQVLIKYSSSRYLNVAKISCPPILAI